MTDDDSVPDRTPDETTNRPPSETEAETGATPGRDDDVPVQTRTSDDQPQPARRDDEYTGGYGGGSQTDDTVAESDSTPDPTTDDARLSRDDRERIANQKIASGDLAEDDDGIASASNFVPERDAEGQLLPRRGETPQSGTILARPLTLGAVKEFFQPDGPSASERRQNRARQRGGQGQDQQATPDDVQGGQNLNDLDTADIAKLIDRYVVKPDLVSEAHDLEERYHVDRHGHGNTDPVDDDLRMTWVDDAGNRHLHENFIDEMAPLAQRDLVLGIIDASGLGDQFDVELTEETGDRQQVNIQQESDAGN